MSNDNKVVGVVVWKRILFSNNVPNVINQLYNPNTITGGLSVTMPDGTTRSIGQQIGIAMVLEEFYRMVQVNIGEAISVAELRSFIKERKAELAGN